MKTHSLITFACHQDRIFSKELCTRIKIFFSKFVQGNQTSYFQNSRMHLENFVDIFLPYYLQFAPTNTYIPKIVFSALSRTQLCN